MNFNFSKKFQNILVLGNGHIPAFLYCGQKPVLVDPGVSAFGPYYLKKIKEHVKEPAGLTILLTHSHFDHCGAVPYLLRKIPGAKVAASPRAAYVLQRSNAIALMKSLNAEYEREMKDELSGEDVSFDAIKVDIELSEGDMLEAGNKENLQVVETPGHTRDCLSYYEPDAGIVFTGESAGVFEAGFMHSPFLTSHEDYVNSLEKIRSLKPRVLAIAHNGILEGSDVSKFLSCSLKAAEDYKEMISGYLKQYSGDRQKVIEKIAREEYDSTPDHIQKRQPFILNLEAKVNAVAGVMQQQKD